MNKTVLLVCQIVFLFVAAVTASAEDFLLNPSFELGTGATPQDWNLAGPNPPQRQNSAMQSTNGHYLLLIGPGGTAWQSFMPAKEDETWTFSGYIKDSSTWQLSGANYGLMSIRFLGPDGARSYDSLLFDPDRARDLWFPWSVTATAPPNTTSVEFWLHVANDDPYGGGGLMFDDFSVSRVAPVPEPGTVPLLLLCGASLYRFLCRGRTGLGVPPYLA